MVSDAEGVDVQQLMAEIRAEVDWKRRAGLYPADVLEELDTSLGTFDSDSLNKIDHRSFKISVAVLIKCFTRVG